VALRGYIDGVIGDRLVGWALDDGALGSRLRVRGELDGVVLGTVEASEPRRDLVTAGFGDGRHGFRIALDPGLLTPGLHRVAAIVGAEAMPLARDWIVRDGEDRPVESVQLAAAPATGAAETAHGPDAGGPAPAQADAAQTDGRALETVAMGVAGWRFDISAGVAARSHAQLDAEAAAIEEFHALADALGIVAHAVVVPAKHVLYAEHLSPEQRTDPGRRPARAVAARLRASDGASVHDLYDALQDARAHGRVYPRAGRALTWVGAIHAYRAIVKALPGPALRPHSLDGFDFGPLTPVPDALDGEEADTEPSLAVAPSAAAAGAPPALVVHDGTAGRIAELLRTQFGGCRVVVAERVDPQLVRRAGADIVIWIREDR